MLLDNQEVVTECEGCVHVLYSVVIHKNICNCFTIPRVQWWFDFICSRATHHPNSTPEDPFEDS